VGKCTESLSKRFWQKAQGDFQKSMMRVSLENIFQSGEILRVPFELNLDSIGILQVETLLRVLPGKRLVMKAKQDGVAFLVKIFRENHSYQKELKGYDLLCAANIATPKRLQYGELTQGAYCFYEYIENLQPFKQVIEQTAEKEKSQRLQELLALLSAMYKGKVFQQDLHFDNFAYAGGVLLAMDPASCRTLHQQNGAQENLALLLAQMPLSEWPTALEDIHHAFPELDSAQLEKRGEQRWKKRLQIFLKKIYRECTYVKRWSLTLAASQRLEIYGVRKHCSESMMRALESVTTPSPAAEYLKRGESSLVYTVEVDGYKKVVKHSRNKTFGRLLRRCLRRSRASNSWYFSHLLLEAGVSAPQPMALVERKWGPFVLESWFISEYVEADTLLDIWYYEKPTASLLAQVKNIFSVMRFLGISHGDMKATNLLVVENRIFLIDYDGATQHATKRCALKAIEKDKTRFLENWNTSPLKKTIL